VFGVRIVYKIELGMLRSSSGIINHQSSSVIINHHQSSSIIISHRHLGFARTG
jgi:hypothetical protein